LFPYFNLERLFYFNLAFQLSFFLEILKSCNHAFNHSFLIEIFLSILKSDAKKGRKNVP